MSAELDLMRVTLAAMDRILDNPARVSTPLEHYETDDSPLFSDLSVGAQRYAICQYVKANTYQLGLVGESINEHKRAADFVTAFSLGDTAEMGRLADIMMREYIGAMVQEEMNNENRD